MLTNDAWQICPTLTDFTFNGWTPAEPGQAAPSWVKPVTVAPETQSENALDTSFGLPAYDGSATVGGFGNIDDDDDDDNYGCDAGDNDLGGFGGPSSLAYDQVFAVPSATFSTTSITAHASGAGGVAVVALASGQERDEYSYLNPAHLRQFAGPRHWRTMTASAAAAAAAATNAENGLSGSAEAVKSSKRAPKARFLVDFAKPMTLSTVVAKSMFKIN